MRKIHVLLKKEELDTQRLSGRIVIVLDILFATTSMVAALAHGAKEVVPTVTGAAALAEAGKRPPASFVLSGELNADTLPGFVHPTPLALLREDLAGRSLLYSTTNGTVAMHKANGADRIYAAALINGRAVVEDIVRRQEDKTVLVVCSGSADNFNLEDFYGAGYFVSLFRQLDGQCEASDAAAAAGLLYQQTNALECLSQARVGRLMLARGLSDEVKFAARKSCYDIVPQLMGTSLQARKD